MPDRSTPAPCNRRADPTRALLLRCRSMARRCAAALVVSALAGPLSAAMPIPKADRKDTRDNPVIKRYEGSLIVSGERKAFDAFAFPLAPLEQVPGKTDDRNNQLFQPGLQKGVEGAYTRLVYLIPPDRSPLEVVRNYQEEVKSAGGKVLYECADIGCGGDATRASGGGGGRMSLSMVLKPLRRINEDVFAPGYCALLSKIADQRFMVAELPGDVHLSVLVYTVKNDNPPEACFSFNNRVFAVVDIVEPKAREQKMVTVTSTQMARAIADAGRVALYGILFDFNKADVKPESDPTIEEMAKLLKSSPEMKLLVVGHTDNVGGLPSNMTLSQRRAGAVVQVLTSRFGIAKERLTPVGVAFAAPVATNKTDEGRARNRRVELVEN